MYASMESKHQVSVEEYEALAEFRYQIRRFLRLSEEAAMQAGLEPSQHQFLLALKGLARQERVTIRDLSARLQLRHHSVVGLINRLVERRLIERRTGAPDRRQVYIHLTPKGEAVLRELSVYHRAELQAAGPALVQALHAVMNRATPRADGEKGASSRA
jgi:DNA-binding MarR family transcriptional regulator